MNRGIAQIKRITGSKFVRKGMKLGVLKVFTAAVIFCLICSAAVMAADDDHFLPAQVRAVSTVPANGDVNPYGVAFVPPGFPTHVGPPEEMERRIEHRPSARSGLSQRSSAA